MPEITSEAKRVVLGSGDAFKAEINGDISTADVDALITTYFTDANRFGDTKNGATFTYTPTYYEVNDDLGRIYESFLTKEDVVLSFGSVTVEPSMLTTAIETARKSTTTAGRTAMKIGGVGNATDKKYFIGFKHTDLKRGSIYVMIIGKNNGEFQFNFQPETETITNLSFKGLAMDNEGTRVIIVFDKPSAQAPSE